jgi:hypothetical protein
MIEEEEVKRIIEFSLAKFHVHSSYEIILLSHERVDKIYLEDILIQNVKLANLESELQSKLISTEEYNKKRERIIGEQGCTLKELRAQNKGPAAIIFNMETLIWKHYWPQLNILIHL